MSEQISHFPVGLSEDFRRLCAELKGIDPDLFPTDPDTKLVDTDMDELDLV